MVNSANAASKHYDSSFNFFYLVTSISGQLILLLNQESWYLNVVCSFIASWPRYQDVIPEFERKRVRFTLPQSVPTIVGVFSDRTVYAIKPNNKSIEFKKQKKNIYLK